MTAYGAVISLKNTIDYILHSSNFTLVDPSLDLIQLAYNELQPLQFILSRLDSTSKSRSRKKVNALDARIKHTIWQFEDSLESHLSQQITSQGNMMRLRDHIASFIHALKGMEKDYLYELDNMDEDEDDEEHDRSNNVAKSKMIGLWDQFKQVKDDLIRRNVLPRYGRKHVFALVGTAGVGKTTLAREIYEDLQIMSYFDRRAWVRVGRKPRLGQLSRDILAELYGNEVVGDHFKERLKGRQCLVVLDDVWETSVLDSLISSLGISIRYESIQIMVTARDRKVIAKITLKVSSSCKVVRFLNEEESKDLLCEKVFGGKDLCPPQLHKAATKIANKCEGLPLMIVTVADHLSKSQNIDPEYWDDVAEQRNSVFTDAYDQIAKVLFPSYDYLNQYPKMLFLYLGVFPLDCDFKPSKIINMLRAEGWFHDKAERKSLEDSVWECLTMLCIESNLVLFNMRSVPRYGEKMRILKTCWLHSSWRHVCRGEARRNKFYHVLNRLVDGSEQGQRCMCLENNILFGFKEFCSSVSLNCASSTRSLLFFGPYHQYPIPIPIYDGFRFLRELDALKLRFYTFPVEILTLIQLKYLALSCNGELPTTISKLFKLQVLIIHPHMNIRHRRGPSYIPIQIWDMTELVHVEITGKSLQASSHLTSLEKLSTLVGVNANIGIILELSRRIPNIRKLHVQIELTPYDDHNDLLSCFDCISKLESLETLKYSVVNPVVESGYVVPAIPSSLMLPRGLEKLHLSGMGFPWEYMDVIGFLPFLKVLKLRSYAFRGSKWEPQEGSFFCLKFLLIEDSDLVEWIPSFGSFSVLSYLSMKHCYKLKEFHWPSRCFLGKIELVDCNPLTLTCAKQLQLRPYAHLHVIFSSSFDKKPMTIQLHRYEVQQYYTYY